MRKRQLDELNRLSPEAFAHSKKHPIVLVLDNIRSGLNVGSAFRTADAFALEAVYLCGITARPPHREILKTAIGASQTVAWQSFDETPQALRALKKAGYTLIGVEQTTSSTMLHEYELPTDAPVALVFGNEVNGIQEEALPLLDGAIEIPQFGTKHSLNVSVCVGIVAWECVRRLS